MKINSIEIPVLKLISTYFITLPPVTLSSIPENIFFAYCIHSIMIVVF